MKTRDEDDLSDAYLPPQVRPSWNRRAHVEHLQDILLAVIIGLVIGGMIAWKLAKIHGHAP